MAKLLAQALLQCNEHLDVLGNVAAKIEHQFNVPAFIDQVKRNPS